LHSAAAFNSGLPIIKMLLHARADINARYMLTQRNMCTAIIRLMGLSYSFGRRSYLRAVCYHGPRATPLITAVLVGALAEAQELLAARADPTLRNARGVDAQTLALRFGDESPWKMKRPTMFRSRTTCADEGPLQLDIFSSVGSTDSVIDSGSLDSNTLSGL